MILSIIIIGGILAMVAALFVSPGSTSRYPDGKCYMCRKGSAFPGDTCNKCGTEQP